MRGITFLVFVVLTVFCWGVYGPVLHEGQMAMGAAGQLSRWRPLVCVGLAYFLIAVVFPLIVLSVRGEKGRWTLLGFVWSFAAGSVGALGALGIILAFTFGGRPVFVMPLVFGCAPVVNTIVTMIMARTIRQASIWFYLGVLVVAIGGAGVMVFKPEAAITPPSAAQHSATDHQPATQTAAAGEPQTNLLLVVASIVLTAMCWGAYGPVLHNGQMRMDASRLRPFFCVGLAYFVIAVALPLAIWDTLPVEPGGWTAGGTIWSLGAGTAGAIGALGIIYAFNFGGKPIFVMPLVFGCAPVVNTFTTIVAQRLYAEMPWAFYLSLTLVIFGAVTVLVCAPRGAKAAPAKQGAN